MGGLARKLAGEAHVVVEPDRAFSTLLAQKTAFDNPYGGAVGIYWPQATGRPLRLLPRDYANSLQLEQDIQEQVRASWLYSKPQYGGTWGAIREAISRRKVQDLRNAGSDELQEYIIAFDAELASVRQQLSQAEEQLNQLRASAQSAQAKSASEKSGLLRSGQERELYPGELSDIIVLSLRASLQGMSDDSRMRIIVEDILQANQVSEARTDLNDRIKVCVSKSGSTSTKLIKGLTTLGFLVTDGGKHYKAVFGGDDRLTFSIAKTPSDYRSGLNLASEINRKIFGK